MTRSPRSPRAMKRDRVETLILLGYCALVFGGLAAVSATFWFWVMQF